MNLKIVDSVNKKSPAGSREVFESIHAIMHLFRGEQYRSFRDGPLELTHMEGRLLGFLARNNGGTLRDLVGFMERDKGQLARLVKNLKEHGLIAGHDDEKDRRSVRLELTAEGRAIHTSLRRRVDRLSDLAIAGLSTAERRQLAALLQRIRTNLTPAPDTPKGEA
ncbi:MAG: winged helix DNA-binding protein [Opitutaceae bacterium]|jgi:DNA-binding MarR family transcriptional regulator